MALWSLTSCSAHCLGPRKAPVALWRSAEFRLFPPLSQLQRLCAVAPCLLPVALLADLLKEEAPSQPGPTLLAAGLSEHVMSFPTFLVGGAEVIIIINLEPLVVPPRPHTQCLPGLCSLSQAVGGGHHNCPIVPPPPNGGSSS